MLLRTHVSYQHALQ